MTPNVTPNETANVTPNETANVMHMNSSLVAKLRNGAARSHRNPKILIFKTTLVWSTRTAVNPGGSYTEKGEALA